MKMTTAAAFTAAKVAANVAAVKAAVDENGGIALEDLEATLRKHAKNACINAQVKCTMSLRPKALDFDEVWMRLEESCDRVLTLQAVDKTVWNDRFMDVYSLCVAYPEPYSEKLYHHMRGFFENHVKTLYSVVASADQDNLLNVFHQYWINYSCGAAYLNCMFLYLNNQFVKKMKIYSADLLYGSHDNAEVIMEIGELALDAWKKGVTNPLRKKLSHLLLEAIDDDRLGRPGSVRESIICDIIHSFVRVESDDRPMELYKEVFETAFLQRTATYYAEAGSRLIQECSVSEYMKKVTQMIADETARAQKFLHQVSHAKVTEECQRHLVGAHLELFHSECPAMIQQDRRKDLSMLYNLLKPIRGALHPVAQELRIHIESAGLDSIKGLQGDGVPGGFVESLLEVHDRYSLMIKEVFFADQVFTGALDKAFSNIINLRIDSKAPCRSPELLAKYCDLLLKKSSKSSAVNSGTSSVNSPTYGVPTPSVPLVLNTEFEIEDKLSKSITLFKYLDDKDVFQKFYSKMMAKRLIHQLSVSMDMEEAMINRFKQVCGYEFTNKLHRMFTDMSLSADHNAKFNDFLKKKDDVVLPLGFHIYVLQAGAWPLSNSSTIQLLLPPDLARCVSLFEEYYQTRFSGRKLTWLYNIANGELKLNYLKRQYMVTMGVCQIALMQPFERASSITRHDLMQETLLEGEQFDRQLSSLVDVKLLTSSGDVRDFPDLLCSTSSISDFLRLEFWNPSDPSAVISLNMDYSNKRTRFKITAVSQKETPQEIEQTRASVEEDRKLYLQAAIVRIMKSRKVMRHNALIEEVINYAKGRFNPSINMIKKCTETLIEKQYIERSAEAADSYSYIA
ncbi:unnamed protein product [Notodromas monacha]|uniref:Cullin-2 n=1 Tax=Notodromas monacha TaxID=399045 RepID=A0A7R9GE85_9CRUS|nr:unnamed protein product [Notodromas monacha]CAG0919494.1 unnamed protein product [Notodromas monacha]